MSRAPHPDFGDTQALPYRQGAHETTIGTATSLSLVDLMYDGFYMVFLLKNKNLPTDAATFRERVAEFLRDLDRSAHALAQPDDLHQAKYAYCALIDEIVLTSVPRLRDDWERKPLQLQLFGEQLAGENFFARLQALRQQGASRLPVLEVFHLCLLLGFQGKYMLEGSEKLNYLTARLGDEIAHLRGRRVGFAPHWAAPDHVSHALRSQAPLWVISSVLACVALLALAGLRWSLSAQSTRQLAGYQGIVKLPARTAYVNITLP
jgi:type VI secretion system protein ImpK